MNNHPKTTELQIVVGGIYSYTNSFGYTTTLRVVRVTEKSIFVNRMGGNGEWMNHEFREGVKNFSKYTIK